MDKLSLKVEITTGSGYLVDRKRLRQELEAEFKRWVAGQGSYTVSVMLVGDRKIRWLKQKYLGVNEVTDVLAFPLMELNGDKSGFTLPDSEFSLLGDIVISYPQARQQAEKHNRLVMDEVVRLAKHGLRHLLGIDHN